MSYSSLHCGDFLLSHSLMERAMHTAGCTLTTLTKPHAVLRLGHVPFQVPTALDALAQARISSAFTNAPGAPGWLSPSL